MTAPSATLANDVVTEPNGHQPRHETAAIITHMLRAAREHLDMDVAYLTEFADGQQRFRSIDGDARPFGFDVETSIPLEQTYCDRMVRGELDDVIPDTAQNAGVRDLAVTDESALRAYAAAPVRLPGGRIYGTLCCASQQPRVDLGEAEVRVLRAIAEVVATLLQRDDPYEQPKESVRARIARCLRQRDIDIHFQPLVDLRDGRVTGVEALSRFPAEPRQGPHVWFSEAAMVGLGAELEMLAVDLALEQSRQLPDGLTLAVNVSPDVIVDDRLTRRIHTDDFPVDRLVLEITEHAASSDRARIKDRLSELRRLGLRIAIDDTGSGFATLENVVEFAPDIIKADLCLVRGVATDPVRRALLDALATFARDTGRTIVAEGIEDPETLETLRDLGVTHGQGWLFARAMPLPLDRLAYDVGA